MKFVSDLRQVSGFLRGTPICSPNKTDHHKITELSLKVELNTITITRFTVYIPVTNYLVSLNLYQLTP